MGERPHASHSRHLRPRGGRAPPPGPRGTRGKLEATHSLRAPRQPLGKHVRRSIWKAAVRQRTHRLTSQTLRSLPRPLIGEPSASFRAPSNASTHRLAAKRQPTVFPAQVGSAGAPTVDVRSSDACDTRASPVGGPKRKLHAIFERNQAWGSDCTRTFEYRTCFAKRSHCDIQTHRRPRLAIHLPHSNAILHLRTILENVRTSHANRQSIRESCSNILLNRVQSRSPCSNMAATYACVAEPIFEMHSAIGAQRYSAFECAQHDS